ncbi:Protein disulfide-isomerase [Anthophora quadrimaculata]
MKNFVLIFSVLCFFASTLAKIETEDEVLVLTEDNIKEAIEQNDYLLIEFYAPWCGHCKALAPEFAKAAKKLQEIGSPVKLAKVDATVETALSEEYRIPGYPTLKFLRKGFVIEYNGYREADDIVNWVTKKSGPAIKDLPTVEEAKSFIDAHNIAVVGFFKDVESDGAKVFSEAAHSLDHAFGMSSSDEVFNEYGVKDGTIVLFKKFDEGRNDFTGEIDIKKLHNFILIHALPLVVDFNQNIAQIIFSGDMKNHLLIFLSKEAGHYEEYVEKIKEDVKKFREKVLCVTINVDVSDHKRIVEFFGLKKDEIPAMRIIKLERDIAKYKPEKPELSNENIVEFVTAFLEDKLERYFITQDLPEDWDKNPVKVLVSTNFHEVAYDKKKNVLVEFYAPWCGHCKQLAPIYDALGEKYKDAEDLVIAKMDGTENELKDMKINNFPTIILYKKETNEAVTYDGERTLEDLSKFIDSDGTYGEAAEEAQEEDEDDDVPRKDEL